ncbi:MAG: DMT family transporter [Pseudomonadota bacterium]|nr:DMT family transporter [Pseudomonadota bacterium]
MGKASIRSEDLPLAPSRVASGIFNGAAAGALWGLVFIVPILLHDFNAWQISSARYLMFGAVALVLLIPGWARVSTRVGRAEWLALLGLSMLGNIVYYVFLVVGVQWGGSAPAALIIGLIPVLITLAGRREHGAASIRALLAPMALCVFGVLAMTGHSLGDATPQVEHVSRAQRVAGLSCTVGALVSWTLYSVWNRRWLMKRPDISPWDWSLLTGVATGLLALLLAAPAFLAPMLFADASPARHDAGDWLRFWLVTGVVAILASVGGGSFWNHASRLLPPTMIGQMVVFETIFALIYSFLYDWRLPGAMEWIAILSLIGGVVWCTRVHRREPA